MVTAKLSAIVIIVISIIACAVLLVERYKTWSDGKLMVYLLLSCSLMFAYLTLKG